MSDLDGGLQLYPVVKAHDLNLYLQALKHTESPELHETVKEIATDCDRDALLIKVEALGPGVCHEGYESCFFRRLDAGQWKESEPRAYDPAAVYGSN